MNDSNCKSESLGWLVKTQRFCISRVWGRAQEFAFLSFQVMLELLVEGLNCFKQWEFGINESYISKSISVVFLKILFERSLRHNGNHGKDNTTYQLLTNSKSESKILNYTHTKTYTHAHAHTRKHTHSLLIYEKLIY